MDETSQKEDPISDETAAIRRLNSAGQRTGDQETQDAAVVRAARLGRKNKDFDLTNPTTAKILGLTHEGNDHKKKP
ncbi:MAG: hypothetical protein A3F04_01800 [Candidatus Chisholmbacteria bacterium RIFCSPHIGHO2_12_FULL_49_9]|uniref:Uncharacterized protein n=1 Tax=Candidatus Chisholmbacteria bacterium RIFCSPHIGHO2_01_FULL_52_32 TaxID=1797591 RepID=A0A1G1VS13_9BACT|nr:MAG: hypothetical protein A3F04_01800 [Candidatus Chisholmbacteria bacterium RIFCSPHIGHO2_12_FULL_49_9]OGY18160.1 MAG: hypothetical protein A2786_01415 [Candidatus Chisholmbacteria bacterium RIFCSPHIGHO2_01_FULL_52_32]OGY20467.1 MAG: hypothetical protein A2900_05330 [Candidatus Chisholmbacteria bacterium RIFCSPLOWO2_01_FULL_50_28]